MKSIEDFDEGGFTEPFTGGYDILKEKVIEAFDNDQYSFCEYDRKLINSVINDEDEFGSHIYFEFRELLDNLLEERFF